MGSELSTGSTAEFEEDWSNDLLCVRARPMAYSNCHGALLTVGSLTENTHGRDYSYLCTAPASNNNENHIRRFSLDIVIKERMVWIFIWTIFFMYFATRRKCSQTFSNKTVFLFQVAGLDKQHRIIPIHGEQECLLETYCEYY